MSTVRGVKDRRFKFVQLLNSMFEDASLSLKAKGFIGYCLTKTEDWHFHVSHLCKVLKEGEKAIYSVINECVEQGYAYRYQPRKENGDFLPIETIVSDSKVEIQQIKKEIESSPSFKKCLTLRPFGDAIVGDAESCPLSNTVLDSNTQEQQQAQPVAVASSQEIYPCLEPVPISIQEKKIITKCRQEHEVINAIALAESKKIPPDNLPAFINWAAGQNLKPQMPPEEVEKQNREFAQEKLKTDIQTKTCRVDLLSKCVEFVFLASQKQPLVLFFSEIDFKLKLDKYIKQYV